MRATALLFATLKETPANTEVISHQLMLRAGMIRRLASGLYTWMPLGLRVLRKVEKIIREEMNQVSQEIFMPAVQPAELWQESGRWDKMGNLMLKMQDRAGRDFCFGPTHEEVVTDLFRNNVQSYKQLPLNVYQIQTKFRDELRPRFGVMRAREFIMKDAYSLHANAASLEKTYQDMYGAYSRIFTRLGLRFCAVEADTGDIGGSGSHEFHVLANAGEDTLAVSESGKYAANIEAAVAPAVSLPEGSFNSKTIVETPNITKSKEQSEHLNIPLSGMINTYLVKGANAPAVALLVRANHTLNEIKAAKLPQVASPLTYLSTEEATELTHCVSGFIGPIGLNIPVIADESVAIMKHAVCGANKDNQHYAGINVQAEIPNLQIADLRNVEIGDKTPDQKETYTLTRGIEVGHIFMLGDKYSKAMNVSVLDENGKQITPLMGCYGIGVSRIVAAAIEQRFDDRGIVWPTQLAPFQVVLIPINANDVEPAEKLYETLKNLGVDVLLDDRNERPGVKFADSDLIGVSARYVFNQNRNPLVEFKARDSDVMSHVTVEQIIEKYQSS